ncbi:hypothetical protein BH09MYX1_BH09MYX1_03170 [soil metagenome]
MNNTNGIAERLVLSTGILLVLVAALACKKSTTTGTDGATESTPGSTSTAVSTTTATAATGSPTSEGTEADAKATLEKFLAPGADTSALTKELKPTSRDYATVFGASAAKAEAYYTTLWSDPKLAVGPKSGQTALILFASTTDTVTKSPGDFPSNYTKAQLTAGMPIYAWKFVEPGKTIGMAFDGLVFVNGHFALFPKPWKATE